MIQTIGLYHGTNSLSLHEITRSKGFDINKCRSSVDFGAGVYVTTNKAQAEEWARKSAWRESRKPGKTAASQKIIEFELCLNDLAKCANVFFIRSTAEYQRLVRLCRDAQGASSDFGFCPHDFDVVGGLVATGLDYSTTIPDYDQLSFHTPKALKLLYDAIK